MKDIVLAYTLGLGLPAFPCRNTPENKKTDKTPLTKNGYLDASDDPGKIREMVRFGSVNASDVDVSNPGCPGVQCRILVEIPTHGIRCVEPVTALDSPSTP